MNIKETIDKRIEKLEATRKVAIQKGDVALANQTWARWNELKTLKQQFTDKDGVWESVE